MASIVHLANGLLLQHVSPLHVYECEELGLTLWQIPWTSDRQCIVQAHTASHATLDMAQRHMAWGMPQVAGWPVAAAVCQRLC